MCAHDSILLAVEQSTDVGSVALLRGHTLLAQRQWTASRARHQQLFTSLPELWQETGLTLDSVDVYALGTGPGSYTGLRMALSALRAFALPDHREVFAVSSAEIIAREVVASRPADRVVVLGDARRSQIWMRQFTVNGGRMEATADWALLSLAELSALPPSVVATSDWDRIGDAVLRVLPSQAELVRERVVPSAAMLGRIVAQRRADGVASDALSPVYLHPAVSTPPTFLG